jgi:hypothetical protein
LISKNFRADDSCAKPTSLKLAKVSFFHVHLDLEERASFQKFIEMVTDLSPSLSCARLYCVCV